MSNIKPVRFNMDKLQGQILLYGGIALTILFLLGPFAWLILSSFQTEKNLLDTSASIIPDEWNFSGYKDLVIGLLKGESSGVPYQARVFLTSVKNSVIVAVGVAFFACLIGSLAAYPLARFKMRGKTFILFFILGSRIIPALALAVPFYLIANYLELVNRLETIILINLSFVLPYVIWLLYAYFKSIPVELEESAMMDGCGKLGILVRIILPLSLPGIASTAILSFLMAWGEFFFALILSNNEKAYTSTVVISMFATDIDVKYSQILSAGVVAVLPPVLFALIFQKFIISGLLSGAVKN